MVKKHFYVVRRGRKCGIFSSWEETKAQVEGFPDALYKGFATRPDAEQWMNESGSAVRTPPKPHVDLKPRPSSPVRHREPDVPAGSVVAYCDGACPDNGKPNARAGIGIYFGDNDTRNRSQRLSPQLYRQTNQVAELVAAITTVQVAELKVPLYVLTDSRYVVESMNSWRARWKRKQWRIDSPNRDLLIELSNLLDTRPSPVYFRHVKGHGSCVGNIMADQLATAGALKDA